MLFRALTTCAGKHSFQSGETVDLPESEAAELVSGGALQPLEAPKAEPEAEAPKAEAPAPAAKSTKK